ncbi:MAG: FHA domain-containing protein [Oligoflexia bacterium]|nr:FHA domain-containing protein [Oligoflexia bacterium]
MISQFSVFNNESEFFFDPHMRQLLIELVNQDGSAVQLGKLSGAQTFIGREPGEGGVTVDNSAVSRQHGLICCGRAHWLYKDLGSTNGTWHNGAPVTGGSWRILRHGDLLQLADSVLRLTEEKPPGYSSPASGTSIGGRALIVFAHGNFQEEYPVPEYGRALVVGGSRGDLQLEGDLAELPTLVVERRGDKICAFGLSKDLKVQVNDKEMTDLVSLRDGDQLTLGQYIILFSDPSSAEKKATGPVPGTPQRDPGSISRTVEQTTKLAGVREWGNGSERGSGAAAKPQVRSQFGQRPELDETVAIDPRSLSEGSQGFDRPPASRYAVAPSSSSSLENLEDKVILIIGGLLVLAVLVLLIWWFLG